MRRFLAVVLGCAAMALVPAVASAARNPSGTGQPSVECGDHGAESQPAGFGTGGFAHAETVYAGADATPSAANGNAHAVAQYDVACFQVTSAGH
jgi:hypothetical protein